MHIAKVAIVTLALLTTAVAFAAEPSSSPHRGGTHGAAWRMIRNEPPLPASEKLQSNPRLIRTFALSSKLPPRFVRDGKPAAAAERVVADF